MTRSAARTELDCLSSGCGRGVKKTSLEIKGWLKDVAPSAELRKWFSHDPAKWDEFRRRYFSELEANPDAWQPIIEVARHGTVTLIYSSHDTEHNNAIALEEFLKRHLPRKWCVKRIENWSLTSLQQWLLKTGGRSCVRALIKL